jgi:hypothetical protein
VRDGVGDAHAGADGGHRGEALGQLGADQFLVRFVRVLELVEARVEHA